MIRRPPRSTLFPTRRSSDLAFCEPVRTKSRPPPHRSVSTGEPASDVRSEEHTSELQSLAYLVCRLLLEKKKKLEEEIDCRARRCERLVSIFTPPRFTAERIT